MTMINDVEELTEKGLMDTFDDNVELTGREEEISADDVELEEFRKYIGEEADYVIFDKNVLLHFVRFINSCYRLGFDVYTASFKMDTLDLEKEKKVHFVYNNGLVFSKSTVEVEEFKGDIGSYIVDVDIMVKLFANSKSRIYLFKNKEGLYGYLFGGRVFMKVYEVVKDICSKEHLIDVLKGDPEEKIALEDNFMPLLSTAVELVKLGKRVEEKALYFEEGKSYIYSGVVMAELFSGIKHKIVLQHLHIIFLMNFFVDAVDALEIKIFKEFFEFGCGGRYIYISKSGFVLNDDMKYSGGSLKNSVTLDGDVLKKIVSFLYNMKGTADMVRLLPDTKGMVVECYQETLNDKSRFLIEGGIKGEGFSPIQIKLEVLKPFMKIFEGELELGAQSNKLYLNSEIGRMLIYGAV